MATKKWSANIMFPKDSCYQNRCMDITFSPSKSSGNPMLTINCELVAPTTVEVGEDIVDITGIKTTNYMTVTAFEDDGKTVDENKTKESRAKVKEFLAMMKVGGKPVIDPETVNWDNPQLSALRGKVFLTSMESEVREERKTPNKAELEEAKKKGIHASQAGKVMKDPVSGKDLIQYWPKIRSFFGLASSGHAGNPY